MRIADIVQTVLDHHPKDCIFMNDVLKVIMSFCDDAVYDKRRHTKIIDQLEAGIKYAELYCPHEGINRLPNVS